MLDIFYGKRFKEISIRVTTKIQSVGPRAREREKESKEIMKKSSAKKRLTNQKSDSDTEDLSGSNRDRVSKTRRRLLFSMKFS